eukprot:27083-Pyramimonas_sp.AAC.1
MLPPPTAMSTSRTPSMSLTVGQWGSKLPRTAGPPMHPCGSGSTVRLQIIGYHLIKVTKVRGHSTSV